MDEKEPTGGCRLANITFICVVHVSSHTEVMRAPLIHTTCPVIKIAWPKTPLAFNG